VRINTGLFIRERLLECEDYPFHMYRLLKEAKRRLGLKAGSYQNFRNYIFWLSRLGLIEFVREEPAEKKKPITPLNRRYYRLTEKGRRRPDLFINPRRLLYSASYKKSH